ncbi:unnamed protein product [Adineta steineri]|uniref:Transmembrane protein n=2 Tax=Adineta steineri TaxID=433720 RepID=A0A818YC56_9BILA|nr:unnamed protein product [Adineta steineri]CAF3752127.1 unnamed protein product [Adineta steineri]
MSRNYVRRQISSGRRKSTTLPVFLHEQEEIQNARRLSTCASLQRRLSTISQTVLPHGDEYHPQQHVPPSGPEAPQSILVRSTDDDNNVFPSRRLSTISQKFNALDESFTSSEEHKQEKLNKFHRKFLFIIEPILSGMFIFPILVLFWECGWNLILILLNRLNGFPSNLHLDEITQEDFESYTFLSLFIPYLITEIILLCYYLGQDFFHEFLKEKHWFIKTILLKFHIFLLASLYIVQWEMLWTLWDQFTPHETYFEVTLSIAAIFALIVFIGHLSDLVCSPFLFSYDSIEYCIYFGCPLLTRNMKIWKINVINYILYEIIISNLSIMIWRGFYHILDDHFYPDNLTLSAGLCLIMGYILYFPLMYFQNYLEELNLKFEFWTFVSINFPQFYRNIRHLLAFFSCLFTWRGFWVLYDTYIYIYDDYYITYLIFYIVSFIVLCIFQTASSTNGPLSNMEDENDFFPLYPHCYISIVQRKLSRLPCFQSKDEENTHL